MMISLASISASSLAAGLGHMMKEASFMFWDTLWALALGFLLSGAIQAFSKRDSMRRHMGDHRIPSIVRATGLGMVSSSCSYAASAMARALWIKGADFLTAMVFMFASTNLVIELGVVLIVLMGWQFAVGEFVGGFIMIGLLVLLGAHSLRSPKRPEVLGDAGTQDHGAAEDGGNWRSKRSWADASGYAIADLTMLRKEMLIGYLVAGMLAAWVPISLWGHIFLSGHGLWSDMWNAVVGPLIAILAFVCSVGNIPLAAALWAGGISFAGVISFIFADLITFPLLMIYAKMYGRPTMLRLLGIFWLVMSLAGMAVQLIFSALGLIPTHRTMAQMVSGPSWNLTSYLNIISVIAVFIAWRLAKSPSRLEDSRFAIDPVCGMQVERAHAAATERNDGEEYFFCAPRCAERFAGDPQRFLGAAEPKGMDETMPGTQHLGLSIGRKTQLDETEETDPVCSMRVKPESAAGYADYEMQRYYFCGLGCRERFLADPSSFLTQSAT